MQNEVLQIHANFGPYEQAYQRFAQTYKSRGLMHIFDMHKVKTKRFLYGMQITLLYSVQKGNGWKDRYKLAHLTF